MQFQRPVWRDKLKAMISMKIKKGATEVTPFSVGAARFELATSWSQTRRDNRATLRPELLSRGANVGDRTLLNKISS